FLDRRQTTDAALKTLRQAGLLHALSAAQAFPLRRAARPEEVYSLNLLGTLVPDEGVAELAGLTGLVSLDLSATKVAGPGLKHLAGMKNLSALRLDGSPVDD